MPIEEILINTGDWLKITHPSVEEGGDGAVVYVRIKNTNIGISTNPNNTSFPSFSDTIGLDMFNSLGMKRVLNWHNCYSFGNGVESNRIADVFNMPQLTPGVKVSTIFEDYKEEHRKYGLIYSGLYNSNSGMNNLNQFIQAEKITKDINPTYGSIQKLHARDTDLIALCEDKVLRILASKDALYNADGNPQLTATNRVLGQAIPYIGEFGISKNPESFVSEAYRSYFTDKQRGAVIRLSRDGLTPISMHGMKDWFRDNLSTSRVNLLGEDILESDDNWDLPSTANVKVENGVAILGYYNNDIHDSRYGKIARFRKNNILEIGKKYRLQYDVVNHGGLEHQSGGFSSITTVNTYPGSGWLSAPHGNNSKIPGAHVNVTWIANRTSLSILQYQVNTPAGFYTPPGGTQDTIRNYVRAERIAAGWPDVNNNGIPDGNDYPTTSWLYAGIVTIANMVLEEVKIEPKITGSYDDRQDEYNVTIHSDIPKTVSFREDVTGWVSFKSFFPENAISCANDYYTIKDGKLWQHHIQGANSNTFYGEQTNSSLNVILNEQPGSIKSFHTLDYEGSDSRVEGIRTAEVTGIQHAYTNFDGRYFFFEESDMNLLLNRSDWFAVGAGTSNPGKAIEMKQYRNNILIYSGLMMLWDNANNVNSGIASTSGGPTKGHGRRCVLDGGVGDVSNPGDFQVGDVITTEEQEKTVNHFNSMPKDGWWVSNIETDKQKGSLPEFIEKEGKWFNYIKGIDSDISETTDFGSFDIQGIGTVENMDFADEVTINGNQPQNNWNTNPKHIWLDASPPAIITVGMDITDSAGLIPPNTTITQIALEPFTQLWYIRISQATTTWLVGYQPLTVAYNDIITFADNINSSLQVGDTLYFERPSEVLEDDIVDMNEYTAQTLLSFPSPGPSST